MASCFTIQGINNPGYGVHVDSYGKLETHSVSLKEQSRAAENGELFNFGSGIQTITDSVETPMFYLKNTGENRNLKITQVVLTTSRSTGAPDQPMILRLHRNVDGGTILNQPNIPPVNFNIGSGNEITIDSKIGAPGLTMTSEFALQVLIPNDKERLTIDTDSIVIPRGRSVGLSLQAASGNTNMLASVSINLYLQEDAD